MLLCLPPIEHIHVLAWNHNFLMRVQLLVWWEHAAMEQARRASPRHGTQSLTWTMQSMLISCRLHVSVKKHCYPLLLKATMPSR
eukprot:scaffold360_cov374-Pavlova_lutheri.AAC.65